MTTVYVERRNGNITGVYRNLQPGQAEEAIDSSDASVIAFLNPTPPTDADRAGQAAAADPFMRALVKLLAAQSVNIFGVSRTVPQVIAILKALA